MAMTALAATPQPPDTEALDPRKFQDPDVTVKGQPRASVALGELRTLWFNTGTLCNLTCAHCYIESSPTNDRLQYLTVAEVTDYLDQVAAARAPVDEIGFTGGEPFMNPDIIELIAAALGRGHRVLVLTNAMRPMMKLATPLLALIERHGARLTLRVSLDHYAKAWHERERGRHTWEKTLPGLKWLSDNGVRLHVAGRTCWGEPEAALRAGYARLFADQGIRVDAHDRAQLVLLPEMDASVDVPEITEACWSLLGVDPGRMMCASSRMVIKRKGAARPVLVPCTLLPYDRQFELGAALAEALGPVKLNHPHCAKFCVLGGGSCSAGD
jgi:uncharacterized Fe-S cluster-containing radical SAM superfamily protein